MLSLEAETGHCIESALGYKYCFFHNSLGLGGVDLLDKIKAFLDHLWKMASFFLMRSQIKIIITVQI